MPNITLEKPASAATQVIVGTLGTDASDDFIIKVTQYRFSLWSPEAETTGDGDSVPVWENNRLIYGNFLIVGAMVAGVAYGLANLIDASNNPTPAAIRFIHGGTRALDAQLLVRNLEISWQRPGQYVGMRMTGRTTDTHPAEVSVA